MKWKFWVGIIISGVFLYLAFRKIEFKEVGQAFKDANYLYVVVSGALMIVSLWARAYRWKYLLFPVKRIGIPSLFSSIMIGFMANNLLPARLGEFVRAYSIGSKENISKSSALATIVIERVFDGFTVLSFLAMVLIFFDFPDWVRKGGYFAFGFFMGVLIFLIFLRLHTKKVIKRVDSWLRFLPVGARDKLKNMLYSFAEGLQVLKNSHHLIMVIIFSVAVWLVVASAFEFAILAFDLKVPIYAAFVLMVILALGVMIPSSPGFVGTYHYLCIVSLALFAISKDVALSFSVVAHASGFIPITLIGLYYLWRESLSLRDLTSKEKI